MRCGRALLVLTVTGFVGIACAPSTPEPGDSALGGADTPSVAAGQPGDLLADVARLERQLRQLAKADGCESAGQCKTVPVGERACGGPREYVMYCPLTTDEPALLAVVDSLKQAEMRHNQATGAISTCEYRMPPRAEIDAGRCVAVGNR